MEKLIILELGGETRSLDFTRTGLFEHIKDATGQDPFEWSEKFKVENKGSILTTMEDVTVLAYAGLNSYQDVRDLPSFPLEQVKRWVRSIPRDHLSKILTAFFDGLAGEREEVKPGEPVAPQQNGQM